jgi:hypothetical protein
MTVTMMCKQFFYVIQLCIKSPKNAVVVKVALAAASMHRVVVTGQEVSQTRDCDAHS